MIHEASLNTKRLAEKTTIRQADRQTDRHNTTLLGW